MKCFLCALATIAISLAYAGSDSALATGKYNLRPGDDALALAKTLGLPSPEGCLTLAPDGSFDLNLKSQGSSVHRHGQFKIDGQKISVKFEDSDSAVTGELDHGLIKLCGLTYARGDVLKTDPSAAKPAVTLETILGAWTVHTGGKDNRGNKMVFDKDGKFHFAGYGASSAGKFTLHDGVITLVWLSVDGEKVEEGSVKKDLVVAADGKSFEVDTYHYERAG